MLQEIAEIYINNAHLYPNNANKDIYELCWKYCLGNANNTQIKILKKYFAL